MYSLNILVSNVLNKQLHIADYIYYTVVWCILYSGTKLRYTVGLHVTSHSISYFAALL